jgi:hypothetical protein
VVPGTPNTSLFPISSSTVMCILLNRENNFRRAA